MRAALALARRGLGQVAPNPSVGCVLVKDGRVIGRGRTQAGGRPHGETQALAMAGEAARGATAYVSLEPCAHHGQTPPCVEALVAAGIARCVIAVRDPDSRVAGRGIERLQRAGIMVDVGCCADEATALNRGFFQCRELARPLVTLKLATSIDGRIATRSGQSQWITSTPARARGHMLRASHDAIMVGSGTAISDNPRLSVRLTGLEERAPLRVVVDGRLRLPLTHDLVRRAKDQPTCLITGQDVAGDRLAAYMDSGVDVLQVGPDPNHRPSLSQAMQGLAKKGVTRLLVEGGAYMAASLLLEDLVDQLLVFQAGMILGGDAIPVTVGLGVAELAAAPRFRLTEQSRIGPDSLSVYERMRD